MLSFEILKIEALLFVLVSFIYCFRLQYNIEYNLVILSCSKLLKAVFKCSVIVYPELHGGQ